MGNKSNLRMNGRLIIDRPQEGSRNMAVDEAIMMRAFELNVLTLRFYQWQQPTLSLGYFQNYRSRDQHAESQSCSVVRRNSGGGAILHDDELTYSLSVPATTSGTDRYSSLYQEIHLSLLDALSEFGIQAEINRTHQPGLESEFLCFQRRAANDVLLSGHKICGSAQRKKNKAISQHGSLVLGSSAAAPQIIGTEVISGIRLERMEVLKGWKEAISSRLGIHFQEAELTDCEEFDAQRLQKGKFGTVKWNQRR